MKSFEYLGWFWLPDDTGEGWWWMPDDPKEYMSGTLSFTPDNGGRLEMTRHPLDDRSHRGREFWEMERIDIIHGLAQGKFFTLQGCYVTKFTPMAHPEYFQFYVGYIYEGHLFNKEEDIIFEKLFVDYTHLIQWVYEYAGRITSQDIKPNIGKVEVINLVYEPFKPINIFDDGSIKIHLDINSSFGQNTVTGIEIKNSAHIIIESLVDKKSFIDYVKLINIDLPNFLTLATGLLNHPYYLSGTIITPEQRQRSIRIYFKLLKYEEVDKSKTDLNATLFTFKDIVGDIQTYLSNWINKSNDDELLNVYDQFFKHHYQRYLDLEEQTLSFARALEIYTKYLFPKDKGESNRVRYEKLCACTLKEYEAIIKELFGGSETFAQQLTVIENRFDHLQKKPTDEEILTIIDKDLYKYNNKLEMLLRLCFLVEMELPPKKIKQIIRRSIDLDRLLKAN